MDHKVIEQIKIVLCSQLLAKMIARLKIFEIIILKAHVRNTFSNPDTLAFLLIVLKVTIALIDHHVVVNSFKAMLGVKQMAGCGGLCL